MLFLDILRNVSEGQIKTKIIKKYNKCTGFLIVNIISIKVGR